MSKPSDLELERDGIHQWLGRTRKEISERIEIEALEGQHHEGMLHLEMVAAYVRGAIKLPKGRPSKLGAKVCEPTWDDEVRKDYKALREAGVRREAAIEQLAEKYRKVFASIENAVRRKRAQA